MKNLRNIIIIASLVLSLSLVSVGFAEGQVFAQGVFAQDVFAQGNTAPD